jgi:hypothetical protein
MSTISPPLVYDKQESVLDDIDSEFEVDDSARSLAFQQFLHDAAIIEARIQRVCPGYRCDMKEVRFSSHGESSDQIATMIGVDYINDFDIFGLEQLAPPHVQISSPPVISTSTQSVSAQTEMLNFSQREVYTETDFDIPDLNTSVNETINELNRKSLELGSNSGEHVLSNSIVVNNAPEVLPEQHAVGVCTVMPAETEAPSVASNNTRPENVAAIRSEMLVWLQNSFATKQPTETNVENTLSLATAADLHRWQQEQEWLETAIRQRIEWLTRNKSDKE